MSTAFFTTGREIADTSASWKASSPRLVTGAGVPIRHVHGALLAAGLHKLHR
jgi:hypothetical protein